MSNTNHPDDPSMNSITAWDAIAGYWDDYMGEGNKWHLELVAPNVLRLLELRADERVLDLGCGNGLFARRLASMGARVLAVDGSAVMLERARAHDSPHNERIEYHVADLTDERALTILGEHSFDAAVCNMVLMDIPVIEPLFRALTHLLKPGGRFVFAMQHPCFMTNAPRFVAEVVEGETEMIEMRSLALTYYLTPRTTRGVALRGQPSLQPYYHRSLHELLGAAFDAGLVLDGLAEPAFSEPTSSWYSWGYYSEFPPVMVGRLRLP